MELNERQVKLYGKINTDRDLAIGDDLAVIVTCTGKEEKDNQDGTYNKVYKCKVFGERD